MGTPTFVLCLFVAAVALAMWSDVRLGDRGPSDFSRILLHAVAAFVLLRFAKVSVVGVAASKEDVWTLLALLGVLLPALVYVFLATLWVLKVVRGALPR